jgi:hypothetical protein
MVHHLKHVATKSFSLHFTL